MIPQEMHPALMGVVPATLITSSKAGIPNITNIARVWYVDDFHVAVANHMLNKSLKNLLENPFAFIRTVDTNSFSTWEIEAEFIESRTDGAIVAEMKKQYEVLTMMTNSVLPISVRSAVVFRVISARICEEERSQQLSNTDLYNPILEQLEDKFGWDQSAVWIPADTSDHLHLAAHRGLDEKVLMDVLNRVAHWSCQQEKPIRLNNIRSQYQYALTAFLHQTEKDKFSLKDYQNVKHHYVAIPIKNDEKIMAVICSQSNDSYVFNSFNEAALNVAVKHFSQLIGKLPGISGPKKRIEVIELELERIRMEISKKKGEVKTPLSPREVQVAVQVAKGLTNEEIAKTLFLSKRTVTTHLERIYQKLNINSRAALASYIMENGLTDSAN